MDHQELYDKLKFDSFTRFEDFLHYIQTELVQFIVSKYLEELNMNRNKEINYKNFLSLLTIYYFKEEFNLNDNDFLKIKNFVNSFNDIEKRKCIFIHNWNNIEKLVTKIVDDNKNSVTEDYVKIIFNLTKLLNDISEDDSKTQLEQTKNYYTELLTQIKGDKTDEYIQTISNKLENNNTYDDFRKNVFFDKLQKELNTTQEQEPKYDAILYLLDTIRNKLCNLTPNRKDLKNYINEKINIDFINQKIQKKVFNAFDLEALLHFIVEQLRNLQAKSDDDDLKLWINNIKDKYLSNTSLTFDSYLPEILKTLIDKIEKVEDDVKSYKEFIKHNM
jgi:hypothetical protein